MTTQVPTNVPPIEDWNHLLEGKVAVVTGGGAGIGAAICELFARHGAVLEVAEIDGDRAKTEGSSAGPAPIVPVLPVTTIWNSEPSMGVPTIATLRGLLAEAIRLLYTDETPSVKLQIFDEPPSAGLPSHNETVQLCAPAARLAVK